MDGNPRIFYNVADADIVAQSNAPEVFQQQFGDNRTTEYYAND